MVVRNIDLHFIIRALEPWTTHFIIRVLDPPDESEVGPYKTEYM